MESTNVTIAVTDSFAVRNWILIEDAHATRGIELFLEGGPQVGGVRQPLVAIGANEEDPYFAEHTLNGAGVTSTKCLVEVAHGLPCLF